VLRINRAQEQAFRLIMQLAQAGRQQTLADLADGEGLPEPTVAKLLGRLRQGGVVDAVRGRSGGYRLAARSDEISAHQVLSALGDTPDLERHCGSARTDSVACPRHDDCGLRSVWRHLQLKVTQVLENTTIADLLQTEPTMDRYLNSLWSATADEHPGADRR